MKCSRFTSRAKALRCNLIDAETLLWSRIKRKQLGVKFRRQYPVYGYIVDFACLERNLIIEVDGGQHQDSKWDVSRTKTLQDSGYKVLRFWNTEVLKNIEGVLERIRQELQSPSP